MWGMWGIWDKVGIHGQTRKWAKGLSYLATCVIWTANDERKIFKQLHKRHDATQSLASHRHYIVHSVLMLQWDGTAPKDPTLFPFCAVSRLQLSNVNSKGPQVAILTWLAPTGAFLLQGVVEVALRSAYVLHYGGRIKIQSLKGSAGLDESYMQWGSDFSLDWRSGMIVENNGRWWEGRKYNMMQWDGMWWKGKDKARPHTCNEILWE